MLLNLICRLVYVSSFFFCFVKFFLLFFCTLLSLSFCFSMCAVAWNIFNKGNQIHTSFISLFKYDFFFHLLHLFFDFVYICILEIMRRKCTILTQLVNNKTCCYSCIKRLHKKGWLEGRSRRWHCAIIIRDSLNCSSQNYSAQRNIKKKNKAFSFAYNTVAV